MSFRYWIIAAAFVLTCQAFVARSEEQPINQNAESNGQQAGQEQSAHPGFPVRILEEPEESESAKRQQREAEQREIEDLKAQQRAADAAYYAAWLAGGQTILAACGTIALLYSLWLTRRATGAAIESANAARDSVRAGRAWLSFDRISSGPIADSIIRTNDGDTFVATGIWFEFGISNNGQTPAQHARLFNEYRLLNAGDDIPEFNIAIPDGYWGAMVSVGQGLKANVVLNDSESADISDGSKRLILYGKAIYFDMFSDTKKIEDRRTTEFCFEVLHRRGYEVRPDGSKLPKIDYIAVGKQNSQT